MSDDGAAMTPPAFARPWGGTDDVTDLGLPGRAPVHWVDFGGPTDAPPVLLVHGLGGSHLNWVLLARLLRGTRRVYAVDLAGFGLTPGGDPASTVTANSELLAELVRSVIGRPVVLVGNSMGGMVSILLAHAHPELVERLVLLDPALPTPRRNMDPQVAASFVLYGLPRVGEAFVGRIAARDDRRRVQDTTNLCFADPARMDPEVFEAAVALLAYRRGYASNAEAAYLTAARSLMRVLGARRRYQAMMSGLTMPVLLVHGERDRLVPVAAARTAARLNPHWRSAFLPGVGHVPMLEVPERVAELMEEWLTPTNAAPRAGQQSGG